MDGFLSTCVLVHVGLFGLFSICDLRICQATLHVTIHSPETCAQCAEAEYLSAVVRKPLRTGNSKLWHWGNGKLFSDPANFGPLCGARKPGNNGIATEYRLITCPQCKSMLAKDGEKKRI
jgi:hypothetical protein